MIYGEETSRIPFTNGLWLSDSPDIPPGFCADLKNMLVIAPGVLQVRQSFNACFSAVLTSADTFLKIRDQVVGRTAQYFTNTSYLSKVNNQVSNGVAVIHNARDAAKTLSLINYSPTTAGNTLESTRANVYAASTYATSGFVNYGGTVYFYQESIGVRSIATFDFTPGAHTTTVATIAGSPNYGANTLDSPVTLFTFKDRLFLVNKKRVAYTDAATAGGFPTTWNIGTNFFDIPAGTIYRAFIFNNNIYFFTSIGIFTLQVYGSPASWVLRQINIFETTQSYNGVCQNGALFYMVHNRSILAFNGSSTVSISEPIDDYLAGCEGIGVFPFEDGVLVCAQTYTGPKATTTIDSSRVFYFNGKQWSEITLSGFSILCVKDALIDVSCSISEQVATSVVEFAYSNTAIDVGANLTSQTFIVNRKLVAGDGTLLYSANLPIEFTVTPVSFIGVPNREKRIKYGYLSTFKMLLMLQSIHMQKGSVRLRR